MPVNRNALIRYKTIDKCLQNRYRTWTLNDLIEACSDALYEYEGVAKGVSKRTVQGDIQMMRSDKLGYNAPIVIVDKKYYTYEDPNYTITNIPLSKQDLHKLSEAVEFMKQFQGFSHFQELTGLVQKFEDHVYAQKTASQAVIDIEKNEHLKGLEYLDPLYRAIINQKAVQLTYQSFKTRYANTFDYHPYLLKEFRNRWFVVGRRNKRSGILNLALDRILEMAPSTIDYLADEEFDAAAHFHNVIGVSVSPTLPPEKVTLWIAKTHAPYVQTKPLHHSQQVIDGDPTGITITLDVQHNFELEKEILGFGDGIRVIGPRTLKRAIKKRLINAVDLYETELSISKLAILPKRLERKGLALYQSVYTKKEVQSIKRLLDAKLLQGADDVYAQRQLLKKLPALKELLFTKNLQSICAAIDPEAFVVKALYFDKTPQANWAVPWHQDCTIMVKEKKSVPGFVHWREKEGGIGVCPPTHISNNIFTIRVHLDDTDESRGALAVVPGSHNKIFSAQEIELITSNSMPAICEVHQGGVQVMKPLLLHSSTPTRSQKRRRVIHLEFASVELPGGLEWAEKE